eukprot:COSAG01_NODE_5113_length_4479_cov_201.866971_2_plen_66_part_00
MRYRLNRNTLIIIAKHLENCYIYIYINGSRVKGQGSRVKGQGSRVKGQGSRVKGQGSSLDPCATV